MGILRQIGRSIVAFFHETTGPNPGAPDRTLEEVLNRVAAGIARFEPLIAESASLLDLSVEDTRSVFARIDQEQGWVTLVPGVASMGVTRGPRWKTAVAAVVRVEAGARFPEHPHEGAEHVLVLQGGYRTDEGFEFWRGDRDLGAPGTRHALTALPGAPCVCLVVTEAPPV